MGGFGLGLWLNGMPTEPTGRSSDKLGSGSPQTDTTARVRDLEHQVERLNLLNQALWELIRARLNLADSDLERIIKDVDLRDGVQDGRMTTTGMQCPTCHRISSSRHWKCLYCGQQFEKPLMG